MALTKFATRNLILLSVLILSGAGSIGARFTSGYSQCGKGKSTLKAVSMVCCVLYIVEFISQFCLLAFPAWGSNTNVGISIGPLPRLPLARRFRGLVGGMHFTQLFHILYFHSMFSTYFIANILERGSTTAYLWNHKIRSIFFPFFYKLRLSCDPHRRSG